MSAQVIQFIVCNIRHEFIWRWTHKLAKCVSTIRMSFGTSSYGEGCTSLGVRLHYTNVSRIFHNINSVTFLLYTLKMFILQSIMLLANTSKSNQCFKWPQFMSNPVVSMARQRIHTYAKPRPWREMENDVNITCMTLLTKR